MYLSKEFFDTNVFTVEAEVTSVCNFACKYCIDLNAQKQYIDFDALYRFLQTIQSNKLTLVMTGGEPTLHPGLFDFCKKAYSISNLQILMYSNMSASNELYKDLQSLNVKLCPSYHEDYFTLDQLAKKLENLTYQHVYVPCTKANIDNIDNIAKAFKSIKILLLDNQNISPTIVNKLVKFDKDVANQYKILLDDKKHKIKHCNSQYKYLNIDGNGDIYQCMFLENCSKLGNIKDSTKIDTSKFKHICTNKYCYYEF